MAGIMDKVKVVINPEAQEEAKPTASCLDCDWQGELDEADIDHCGDWDEFKGQHVAALFCPRCGGGVEVS